MLLALLDSFGAAADLSAQESAARAAIAAFDDTLSAITSPAELTSFADDPANQPDGRDPLRHLRRGLVLLRLGELGEGRESLDEAIRSFDEATLHARGWPWPWLGLARAKLVLAERGAVVKPSMHQQLGEHYDDAAVTDLARALEIDSTFTPAAHSMATLMAESPGDYPEILHRAVRATAAVPAHGPGMQLLLGRLERHLRRDSVALTVDAFPGDTVAGVVRLVRSGSYQQFSGWKSVVKDVLAKPVSRS